MAVVVLLPPAPLLAAVALVVVLTGAPVAVAELLLVEDVVPPKALATDNDATEGEKLRMNKKRIQKG